MKKLLTSFVIVILLGSDPKLEYNAVVGTELFALSQQLTCMTALGQTPNREALALPNWSSRRTQIPQAKSLVVHEFRKQRDVPIRFDFLEEWKAELSKLPLPDAESLFGLRPEQITVAQAAPALSIASGKNPSFVLRAEDLSRLLCWIPRTAKVGIFKNDESELSIIVMADNVSQKALLTLRLLPQANRPKWVIINKGRIDNTALDAYLTQTGERPFIHPDEASHEWFMRQRLLQLFLIRGFEGVGVITTSRSGDFWGRMGFVGETYWKMQKLGRLLPGVLDPTVDWVNRPILTLQDLWEVVKQRMALNEVSIILYSVVDGVQRKPAAMLGASRFFSSWILSESIARQLWALVPSRLIREETIVFNLIPIPNFSLFETLENRSGGNVTVLLKKYLWLSAPATQGFPLIEAQA